MWREVGVDLEVRPSETATLIADLDGGRFEVCMLQLPEVIEPHVLTWFFGSQNIPRAGHPGANRWRFRSPELDAALGALRGHLRRESPNFQPSNVVWSMFPELPGPELRDKKLKKERMGQRALADLGTWLEAIGVAPAASGPVTPASTEAT